MITESFWYINITKEKGWWQVFQQLDDNFLTQTKAEKTELTY